MHCHLSSVNILEMQNSIHCGFLHGASDLGSGGGENSSSIIRAKQACFEESFSSEYSLQVHEREHDREISELAAKHAEEMEKLRAELKEEQRHLLDELRQQMAATHRAEHEQAQLQSQVKTGNTVINVILT